MNSFVSIGCLAAAWLTMTGCGSRPESAATQESEPQAATGPAAVAAAASQEDSVTTAPPAEAQRGVAGAAASPGKPHAPVDASVVGKPALQSGVPGKVVLEFRPGVAVDALTARVDGNEVLAVVGQALFRSGPLAAGEPVRFEIAVTPTSGGIGRLSALLTLETGGQKQARPVSLALEVGGPVTAQAAAEKTSRPPVRDAAGELVHSMPAETTVKGQDESDP